MYTILMLDRMRRTVRADAQDAVEHNKRIAKDEWVSGFVKGNSRFPFGFFGSSVYLAHAVLEDPKADFSEFLDSTLSIEQLAKLGTVAEAHHTKQTITVSEDSREYVSSAHRPSPEKLERIWEVAKTNAFERLEWFAAVVEPIQGPMIDKHQEFVQYLQDNPLLREQLRNIVNAYIDAMEMPEIKDIRKRYVAAVKERRSAPEKDLIGNAPIVAELREKIAELAQTRLREIFPPPLHDHTARNLTRVFIAGDWPSLNKNAA